MHQDFAGCGVAVPRRVNSYRIASLKSMGANGWRTAHNPVNSVSARAAPGGRGAVPARTRANRHHHAAAIPSHQPFPPTPPPAPAQNLMDECDRQGMLVWLENRNLQRDVIALGARHTPKSREPIHGPDGALVRPAPALDAAPVPNPLYLGDAQAMALRDRNHPSLIIYSLCNEGGCLSDDPQGAAIGEGFKNAIFDVDKLRPITGNLPSWANYDDAFARTLNFYSYSYGYGQVVDMHYTYPFKGQCLGESASCTSDRSYYGATNMTTGFVNQDDHACIVEAWSSDATRPWVVGSFAWTGFDVSGGGSAMQAERVGAALSMHQRPHLTHP